MDEQPRRKSTEDEQLEREILEHRKFTLAEAIGRMGGGELMKGASPIPRKRQAEFVLEGYLEKNLRDAEGALEVVLQRDVAESRAFLEQYDQPLAALTTYCKRLLESEELLRDFVRRVDFEWGRMYLERPRFERPGQPPQQDDPYTLASVREKIESLLATLAAE